MGDKRPLPKDRKLTGIELAMIVVKIEKLEEENKKLREGLEKIYEGTKFADIVTVRLKDVHELARKALEHK